jgi:5-oxoprolinase (ATP-hydrolysing) subunit A
MAIKVDMNSDMGESFGAYTIGNDAALLDIVTSANIACGFHGGDFNVMAEVVAQSVERGVGVGAHPGLNDLWSFGRRVIDVNPRDLENMVAYQIGALQAFATANGTKVVHVKAHGSLGNMAAVDFDIAYAIAKAMKAVDPTMICLGLAGSQIVKAAEKAGIPLAREGFADRTYDDDGNLTSRKLPGAVLHDPDVIVDSMVRLVTQKEIISTSGKKIPMEVDSICVHGDEPSAVAAAAAVRKALEGAGVQVVPLVQMGIV